MCQRFRIGYENRDAVRILINLPLRTLAKELTLGAWQEWVNSMPVMGEKGATDGREETGRE